MPSEVIVVLIDSAREISRAYDDCLFEFFENSVDLNLCSNEHSETDISDKKIETVAANEVFEGYADQNEVASLEIILDSNQTSVPDFICPQQLPFDSLSSVDYLIIDVSVEWSAGSLMFWDPSFDSFEFT